MTDTIYAWSSTAADNGAADGTINFAENQLPNTVNNSARAVMARVAELIDDLAPNVTSTGSVNAYVVTSAAAGGTFRDGEMITFIPHLSNTEACTLNVDGRGAKPWRPKSGVSFVADNILAGVPVTAYYKLSSDEWLSPGTGYYVTNLAAGVALQSITARLPQIGDLVVSYTPTPGPGRLRLTEATQSILKSAYPELNSYLSSIGYPWSSTATHFNLPPAAGYYLRFAATTGAIDADGPRLVGSTQADANKTEVIPATGLTANSTSSSTSFVSGGTVGGTTSSVWGADGGGQSGPVAPASIFVSTSTTTTTTVSGDVTLPGEDEVRTKNVAFHLDVIASTALAAAQVAVFGFPLQWDTGIADANPGAGRARGNNATLGLITTLYISNTDGWGVDISAILLSLVAGNPISLSRVGAQANRIAANVSGLPISGAGYVKVPVSIVAAAGTLTNNANLALEYARGAVGPQGPTGPNTGLDYLFSTVLGGDPGAGTLLFNNATLTSVTQVNISKTGRLGEALGALLGSFDDSTSTSHRGYLTVMSVANRTRFATFSYSAAFIDNASYFSIPVASVNASGTLPTNAEILAVVFSRTGNMGAQGPGGTSVATRTELKAVDTGVIKFAFLTEIGRDGPFAWRTGDFSAQITADTREAIYVKADAIASTAGAWVREYSGAANVRWFGALGDNATDDYDAIEAAWNLCRPNAIDIYFPAGTYVVSGDRNFPFRSTAAPPTALVECNNITVYGDGPSTVLKTVSVTGADILQLNALKNFHVARVKLTATISGSVAGSNGVSVTNGFDNLSVLDVWMEDLPSLDKTTYIDGGRALTFQASAPPNTNTTWGDFNGRIIAKGCTEGVGVEVDLADAVLKPASIRVEFTAERCYIGAKFVADAASAAIPAGFSTGVKIRGQAINCQKDVVLNRAHGVDIDVQVITTETEATRRLKPTGGTWFAPDTIVEAAYMVYAKNSRISVFGYKGACAYKARIGGISAGSSGLVGSTEHCDIYLDIGGVASVANLAAVDFGGNTLLSSALTVTSSTTTAAFPSDFLILANKNVLTLLGEPGKSLTPGNIQFPATQNSSSGTNVLDDYEEGSWTPTFGINGGGSATFTINEAQYTKIGRQVFATFVATRNDATGHAGTVTWSLPFPATGVVNWHPAGTYWVNGGTSPAGVVMINNYAANLGNGRDGSADLSYATVTDTSRLNVTMSYMAAT